MITTNYSCRNSGAVITGTTPKTIRANCPPDAIELGYQDKRYGLYTRETLERWAAGRRGGAA